MPDQKTGTREEWQAARDELAKLEAEYAELGEKVTEQRRTRLCHRGQASTEAGMRVELDFDGLAASIGQLPQRDRHVELMRRDLLSPQLLAGVVEAGQHGGAEADDDVFGVGGGRGHGVAAAQVAGPRPLAGCDLHVPEWLA